MMAATTAGRWGRIAAALAGMTATLAVGAAAIDVDAIDRSVDPCKSFYGFANGKWLAGATLPEGRGRLGVFDEIRDATVEDIERLVNEIAASGPAATSAPAVLTDFVRRAMDLDGIEDGGIDALRPLFDLIDGAAAVSDLPPVLAALHRAGAFAVLRVSVLPHPQRPATKVVMLSPDGLGLGSRDHYVRSGRVGENVRAIYSVHVAEILRLGGIPAPEALAAGRAALAIETELAMASLTPAEMHDVHAQRTVFKVERLKKEFPAFGWERYATELGIPANAEFVVTQPRLFRRFNELLGTQSIENWRRYLRWQVLHAFAVLGPKAIAAQEFTFYGRVMRSQSAPIARSRQVAIWAEHLLPMSVGRAYVDRHFPAGHRRSAEALTQSIRDAFRERLQSRTWMDEETRRRAVAKLDAMQVLVGYPDNWSAEELPRVSGKGLIAATVALNERQFNAMIAETGKPVDRRQWQVPVTSVNAYYLPAQNAMLFPAGILRPPVFDAGSTDPTRNLAAIGALVAHEFTHGFDLSGRMYGADGSLANWWTATDEKRFRERTRPVASLYGGYPLNAEKKVDGVNTLHENLADLGGVKIALEALRKVRPATGSAAAGGFTPDQQFFIAYAQMWRARYSDAFLNSLISSPHPPSRYRVEGVSALSPDFSAAFSCPAGPIAADSELW